MDSILKDPRPRRGPGLPRNHRAFSRAHSRRDGDGIPGKSGDLLNTDPLTANATYRITRISDRSGADAVEVEWPCSRRHLYAVEAKPDPDVPECLDLADVPGTAGTNSVQAIDLGPSNAFFPIGAMLS